MRNAEQLGKYMLRLYIHAAPYKLLIGLAIKCQNSLNITDILITEY